MLAFSDCPEGQICCLYTVTSCEKVDFYIINTCFYLELYSIYFWENKSGFIKIFDPLCSSSVSLSVHHDFTSLQIFATHYSIVKYLSFLCFSATRSRWGTSKFLQVIKPVKRTNHIHFSKAVRYLRDIKEISLLP